MTGSGAADAGFQRLVDRVTAGGRPFGHRQHVELAWLAVREYGGAAAATEHLARWLRHVTAAAGRPEKYHHTMTRAWVELVAHHATADLHHVDALLERHPELLDRTLLARHYSHEVFTGEAARQGWVEPNLRPFPWPCVGV